MGAEKGTILDRPRDPAMLREKRLIRVEKGQKNPDPFAVLGPTYRQIVYPDDRLKETDEAYNMLDGSFEIVSRLQQKDVP